MIPFSLARPALSMPVRGALVGRNRSRGDDTAGRFTRRDCDRLLHAALARYSRMAPEIPVEVTLGARQNVQLAALTVALMQALLDAGIEREYAIELVSDVCWRVYRHWGRFAYAITAVRGRDPQRRISAAAGLFLRFPFARPGYQREDLPDPTARAFRITRCPVAELMRTHDASDLCIASWCDLDYALAQMWGGRLVRPTTIAAGDGRCDFRFLADHEATRMPVTDHAGTPDRTPSQTQHRARG